MTAACHCTCFDGDNERSAGEGTAAGRGRFWHPRGMRVQVAAVGSCLLLAMQLSACAGSSEEASCASGFDYADHSFYPHQVASSVETQESLGQVSSLTCDDGAGQTDTESEEAFAIPGVDPGLAFVVPAAGKRLVFVSGSPQADLPAEVRHALRGVTR